MRYRKSINYLIFTIHYTIDDGGRAYDYGCNLGTPLRDAVGSLRKELIRLWNSILPEPGQPSAQLSKLIRLTTCKKTEHTVSRWYRTVYIPWLVASYDTHKGKRWLNSDSPKPQGELEFLSNWSQYVVVDGYSIKLVTSCQERLRRIAHLNKKSCIIDMREKR